MSYRFMRVLVFFDLPTETVEDQRNYRKFHRFLQKSGFLMMQESVYCRMLLNQSQGKALVELVRKNRPTKGLVQLLTVTERQFASMEYITGSGSCEVVDSDERLVIL